jgi:hypothetical protein
MRRYIITIELESRRTDRQPRHQGRDRRVDDPCRHQRDDPVRAGRQEGVSVRYIIAIAVIGLAAAIWREAGHVQYSPGRNG